MSLFLFSVPIITKSNVKIDSLGNIPNFLNQFVEKMKINKSVLGLA